MSLQESVYSILLVSSAESLNHSFLSLLPDGRYHPVRIVPDVSQAKRELSERAFDFVIVNAPQNAGSAARFAIDVSAGPGTVVLLLVRNEVYEEIHDKVVRHGVYTLSLPTSKPTMLLSLRWLESARERLIKFEKKTLSIEEKMEEIRLVNRAKWLLISELKMTEPEAHRYIEKQAMDSGVTRREIAQNIIRLYS